MIQAMVKAIILAILVLLAAIGAVACVLVYFTIRDDRDQRQ